MTDAVPSLVSRFYSACHLGIAGHESSSQSFGEDDNFVITDFSPVLDIFREVFPEELVDMINRILNPHIEQLEKVKSLNPPDCIYKLLKMTCTGTRQVVISGQYKTMSLTEILKTVTPTFVDFGSCWLGMGHTTVVSWRRSDSKCFIRPSGGGNGWEQLYSYEVAQSLDADSGEFEVTTYTYVNQERIETTTKKTTEMFVYSGEEFLETVLDKTTYDDYGRPSNSLEVIQTWQ